MSTAEQLAFSISTERRGIHVLLWDDQQDLVRALLALYAGLADLGTHALLVSDDKKDLVALRQLVETRVPIAQEQSELQRDSDSRRSQFWLLFLQQASTNTVGPWLNGWRRPISDPPGAMLVIRHADFDSFQRNAPDIASFVGTRIHDASTMLSVFSKVTHEGLKTRLPGEIQTVVSKLPGTSPSEQDIANWVKANAPNED
jgi:hypothetical protein